MTATLATALGALVLVLVPSSQDPVRVGAQTSPPSPMPAIVLRDVSGHDALSVQLQANRRDTGAFDFEVYGVGSYTGQLTVTQPSGVSPSVWTLSAPISASYTPAGGSSRPVTLQITGTVATSDYTALITVADVTNVTGYTITTEHGTAAEAYTASGKIGQAMVARDFATLYTLVDPELLGGATETQFAQTLSAQSAPTLLSVTPTGTGTQQTLMSGYTYYTQPIAVQYQRADQSTATISTNMYLIRENATWYFVSTDTPPSP